MVGLRLSILAGCLLATGCTTYLRDTFEHDKANSKPVTPKGYSGFVNTYADGEVIVRQSSELGGKQLLELSSSENGNKQVKTVFDYPPANIHFGTTFKSNKKHVVISWAQKVERGKLSTVTVFCAGYNVVVRLLIQPGQINAMLPQSDLVAELADGKHIVFLIIEPSTSTYRLAIDDITKPSKAYPVNHKDNTGFYAIRFGNIGSFVSSDDKLLIDDIDIAQED